MKILHIEDNIEFREHVATVLLSDYDIDSADDGSDGITCFDSGSYDIVLLDYQMDCVHGPAVIRHIRKSDNKTIVIAMSMEDRFNDELLELGANIALPKRDVHKILQVIQGLS